PARRTIRRRAPGTGKLSIAACGGSRSVTHSCAMSACCWLSSARSSRCVSPSSAATSASSGAAAGAGGAARRAVRSRRSNSGCIAPPGLLAQRAQLADHLRVAIPAAALGAQLAQLVAQLARELHQLLEQLHRALRLADHSG